MRTLWILCLLIGSMTCVPVDKGFSSNNAGTTSMWQPSSSSSAGGSSDLGSSSSLPSAPHDALSSVGSSYTAHYTSGYGGSAPGSSYGGYAPTHGGDANVLSSAGTSSNMYSSSVLDDRYNSPGVGAVGPAYTASYSSGYDGSAPGGSGTNNAGATFMWQPLSWSSGGVSSHPGSSSSLPSAPHDALSSAGSAYTAHYSSGYGGSAPGAGYGGYSHASGGDSSYGSFPAPRDDAGSSESATSYVAGDPEPVFSDVSDLEPVYSYSSRSRYQQGRAVFAQTEYIPEEPAPPMPVYRAVSTMTSRQSAPANAPAKGGF